MPLDRFRKLCKIIFKVLDVFIAVSASLMFLLGLCLRLSFSANGIVSTGFNTQAFANGMTVLMVLAVLIIIVLFIGEYGYRHENTTVLGLFSILLATLTGLLIGGGAFAYMRHKEIGEQLAKFYITIDFQKKTNKYPMGLTTHSMIEYMCNCCGPTLSSQGKFKCLLNTLETVLDCPSAIINIYQSKGHLVTWFFFGNAALLGLALVCTCLLMRNIKMSRQNTTVDFTLVQGQPPPSTMFKHDSTL
ncbi:hypothetical protein UPYG_G00270500 [Umbra pygmaea]|uniref:Tetraspanin n=1 Tax=Umbra pygmaea TaxID=75934 RepID=A0ABD0WAS5_UMBPY